MPPIVATLNGAPIRAQVVAQAEVLLASQPDPPPAGHAREEAALQLVIRDTLLDNAAIRQGDAPSPEEAQRQLVAMGETQPSPEQISQEQRALASLRLRRQVEGQGTPAQQETRLNAYVQHLLAKAKVVTAPGF